MIFFKQWPVIIIICLTASVGCTKEKLSHPANNDLPNLSKRKTHVKAPNFGELNMDDQKYGSITGRILPADAAVTLYLSEAASIELMVDSTGTIIPNQVPTGQYTIDIISANYYYGYCTISNVIVYADSVSNLGTITLDAGYGDGGGCEIGWGRQKGVR